MTTPSAHVSISRQRDRGFTLVELLVVVIIVGILAGIAIPQYLNQRQKAVEASLKADLRSAAFTAEDLIANPMRTMHDGSWSPAGFRVVTFDLFYRRDFKFTDGNVLRITGDANRGTYQICAYNPAASTHTSGANAMLYDSQAGGLQTTSVDCDGGNTYIGGWHGAWQGLTHSPYGAPADLPWSQYD